MKITSKPIFLVEDDQVDVMTVKRALKEIHVINQVVKHDAQLKRIPVVVLTTSEGQQDKVNSFDLGVVGYMAKPVDYRQFVEVMRSIDVYWTISEMPQ